MQRAKGDVGMCRGVDPGGLGSPDPWKYVGGSEYVLTPKMSHSFIQNSKLLLNNCKFHASKDEQLDTSLILLHWA